MLRLALLENVRRVGVRIARRREERDVAIAWADRMLAAAEGEAKQLIHVLAEFADADVLLTAPFVEEFYARLQIQGPALAFVQTWLEHRLSEQGVSAVQLLEASSRMAAADQISIANSVGSLRFISAMDWGEFVEELSLVEQLLRTDPAGVYASQDFPTRDRYRHAVEAVKSGSGHSELEVARAAIALARGRRGRSRARDAPHRPRRLLPDRQGPPGPGTGHGHQGPAADPGDAGGAAAPAVLLPGAHRAADCAGRGLPARLCGGARPGCRAPGLLRDRRSHRRFGAGRARRPHC